MVASRLMPYKLLAFGLSDIGLVRQNNEDVWAQLPEEGFFLLADGMEGIKPAKLPPAKHRTRSARSS